MSKKWLMITLVQINLVLVFIQQYRDILEIGISKLNLFKINGLVLYIIYLKLSKIIWENSPFFFKTNNLKKDSKNAKESIVWLQKLNII